jgi:cell division protein FtsI (penicillin-binding protein 3)
MQKYELHYDFTAVRSNDLFNSKLDTIAHGLARILGEHTAAEYKTDWAKRRKEAIEKRRHRYHAITRRHVDFTTLKALRKLPLLNMHSSKGGFIAQPHIERIYPHNQLALNTLGWTNATSNGVGIEYSYHTDIAGKAGWEWQQRIGRNTFAPIGSTPEQQHINGSDIVTTIDIDLQTIAEEAIINQLHTYSDIEWGCAVIMDVQTGEIRACANKSKDSITGAITERDNYALRYRKDPGSTFKLITFLIMLERGLDINTIVNTDRVSNPKLCAISEDEGSHGGDLTATEVFEKSSNIGTVNLALGMYPTQRSWSEYRERIRAIGMNKITNFDIKPQQDIRPVLSEECNMFIGYSLEVTPLQTLAVYNAIAGGGNLVHPRFVREVRPQGKPQRRIRKASVVNKNICSKSTLAHLQEMLRGVVERGSAKRAQSNIVSIAGKTGTAYVAESREKYTRKKLASFAGYFPADQPRYSCIVALRSYETPNDFYGGYYAAPVFKTIAEKTYIRTAALPPVPCQEGDICGEAPYTKSGSASQLYKVLDALHIPSENKASALYVSTSVENEKVHMLPRGAVSGIVPDVQGMGLQDAVFVLETYGLRVRINGRGTVLAQAPLPGAACDKGNIVSLRLSIAE